MFPLFDNCDLVILSHEDKICDFDCDNADLNDFFCNDAILYQEQLLGKTSFFRSKENGDIVCAFTLSNDSIKIDELPNSRAKKVERHIPHAKSMKSYPATLIGRLGVSIKYKRQKVGDQLLDFIKSICVTEDANKCRFILVDAYNTEDALGFYSNPHNEFIFVFSTEQQEKDYYEINGDEVLRTRFMFFDLLSWVEKAE